jgi:hypothetical protein
MDGSKLEDRIRWGFNIAARATGSLTSAFRPNGTGNPLDRKNRFLRLHAAFTRRDGKFAEAAYYGDPLWYGIFDGAYTRTGDYLVQETGTWFIAGQEKLLPVLCVRTNAILSFSRPAAQTTAGVSGYGGLTAATATNLMAGWPASVLSVSREARPLADLPANSPASFWSVLLPACSGVTLRIGDLMSDNLGRSGTIATTELSELGWRLSVKQVTT